MPDDIVNRPKRPYRAPILRVFFGADAPEYVSDLLSADALANVGIFDPRRVRTLMARCERSFEKGVSETDEMAIIGVLSTMILHRQFVADPQRSAPARATRVVIGNTVVDPESFRQQDHAALSHCL